MDFSVRAQLAGRLGALIRHHGPNDQRVADTRRQLAYAQAVDLVRDVRALSDLTSADHEALAGILVGEPV